MTAPDIAPYVAMPDGQLNLAIAQRICGWQAVRTPRPYTRSTYLALSVARILAHAGWRLVMAYDDGMRLRMERDGVVIGSTVHEDSSRRSGGIARAICECARAATDIDDGRIQ